MKKAIRITCLLLVLAMTLGVLAACKKEEKKLSGTKIIKGEIIYIAKAPNNILEQYPNSYIIYVATPATYTEELAEVLITEDAEIDHEKDWRNVLEQRITGDKIEAYTYNYTDIIDPDHPKLFVAQVISFAYEAQ